MARKGKIEIGAAVTVGAKEDGSLSAIEKRIEKLSNEEIEINIKDATKHLKELEKMEKALGKNMTGAIEAQRKQFNDLIEKCKEEQRLRAENLKQVEKQVEASKELQKVEGKKSKPQEKKTNEPTQREKELADIAKGLKGIRGVANAFDNPSIQKTEEQVQKLINKLDEYQTKLEAMKRLRKGNERTIFDTAKSEIADLRRALSAIQTVKDQTPTIKPKLEKKEKEIEQEKPKKTTTPTPAPAKDPTAEGIQQQAVAAKEQTRNLAQVNAELEKERENLAKIAQTQSIRTGLNPEELETLRKENASLEEKLELLQEIASQYGNTITQRNRDRYEELNQKELESGLTSKEEERYYELGEAISEADEALEQFGTTYERIILKLENGRKVSILPDDEGLRKLSKFIDEGWGESYNGFDIVDITFERVKAIEEVSGAVETEVKVADENVRSNEKIIASYDELISKLNEFIQLKQKVVDIYNAGGDIKPHNDKLRELEADLVRGMDSSNASSAEMMLQSFPMGIDQKALTGSLAVFLGIEIPIESATEAIQEETKAIEANTQATEKNIETKKKSSQIKLREFTKEEYDTHIERYEKEHGGDAEAVENTVDIIRNASRFGTQFAADMTTSCKKAETAVKRLFSVIDPEKYPALASWKEAILEPVQNGYFSQAETYNGMYLGGYSWGVEALDEDRFYVYINLLDIAKDKESEYAAYQQEEMRKRDEGIRKESNLLNELYTKYDAIAKLREPEWNRDDVIGSYQSRLDYYKQEKALLQDILNLENEISKIPGQYKTGTDFRFVRSQKVGQRRIENSEYNIDYYSKELREAQNELDAKTTPSGQIGMFKGMADPIIAATEETQKLGEAMEEVQRIAGQVSFFGDTVAQEVAQSIVSAMAETTPTAAGQLAQGIQQVGDTAQQTAQQLRQQAAATEILTSSSEQATQQVEQQATITERSAPPSQTPNVLPALTVPERIATIGNGAIDNLLKDYNITNPEAQSEVVNAFDEMARIIKAVFDKAKVEGPVSNKDNLFARLQESADKASSLIIQLGTEAHDTSESLDGLRDFYSFMKGKKIQYNNSIKAEYGDGWGKFYNRFKNYLTPSPTAETAGSLYKHLSGEASDGTGLPNANIDVFREFFPQDLGDDIHQFARIFEVLGNALDASNGGRNWKKIDKIPLRDTSDESKQYIRGQVQDVQIGMIQTLKQMTDASAETLRNEEQLIEGERKVGNAVRNTNEARREGNEEQRKAIQDIGDESENERQSIIERDEARALEVLRKAKDNKTNLVDLSGVYSTDDLKGQLESMASTITGKENLLSVGSVHIQDGIASVIMYNEALGITYKQLYEVSKAAEDAEESQLRLWSESYDENYKAAQKYSEAQKKKIAKDDSWLIGQASKLNTQERKYKYSGKKVEGTTALTDADETTLAEGADRTIDSLTAHIKNKIQSAMGQGLTDEVRNEIINDLRILDNEIKIEQYKKYASTTMKPAELKAAKDELEYTLQSLEAKAKKNNVFSQIEQDVISLRSQLKGVTDGTQLSSFIDNLRVTKSKLNAEIAKEQTTKKEEQNYQNLINLQSRLYEAKKKLNDLEIKGQSDTAEGQQASRKVQELQDQYDLSVKLLQNEEHRRAIEDRGTDLDSQLNTAKDQKQIEQYYQNIFDTVQRINNLDSQINTLKMKDGGKGIYSDLIASLESEKSTLLGKIDQIGADVQQYFNGVFASVGDAEKVQLPLNSLLKDTSSYSTILDFLNNVDVRATLGAEAVNKLVQAFYNSSQAGSEFVEKISAQFKPAEEAFAKLQQIVNDGGLKADNEQYKSLKAMYDMLNNLNNDPNKGNWTSEQIAAFTALSERVKEYSNNLGKAAEQEAKYFAGKTKAYTGDTMYGNPQKNELMVVDQPDKNIDTARQALEKYVATFTEGTGIITGFTTAANGINQITFSALDEGTGQFRTFTAEMGRCTDNIYRTETTLNGLATGTNAAKKSIASLATVMSQLNNISGAEEQLKALWKVYQNLQNAINNKGNSQNVGDQNMLKNMATDADKARKEVEKLIKEWAKAQAGLDDGNLTPFGNIDKNGNIQEQMWERIKTGADGARASFVGFDEKTNTLTYTLMNTDKTVTTMTAHMYGLNGAVTAQQGKTEKLKTGWQEFTGTLNGAVKGIGQYLGRAFSMWAIVGQLKQGFNAVKQIDAALTELKKVTDETEASYRNFLETASKTAGQIGSTVSDFTLASANFARLGYTMEESAKMAETAIVYKNVADGLDTVEESTESIISTMKAFGIESDNTMSIIDKFNEVGNNFSITSAGIGEALQRSASALYEAGNSIDESIALVTAANSVIQNPEQVGECLPTIK